MRKERFCKNCGVKLEGKWQISFCSRSCSATFNNTGRVKVPHSRVCEVCGGSKHGSRGKMCVKCARTAPRKTFETAVQDRTKKRLLILERGQKCESCGFETWLDTPIPLELHHIDGNSDNSDRSNLLLICPNCHALTSTYRAANIGNGSKRSEYRKRYYHGNDE